jgi:hypothetical protein
MNSMDKMESFRAKVLKSRSNHFTLVTNLSWNMWFIVFVSSTCMLSSIHYALDSRRLDAGFDFNSKFLPRHFNS